MKLKLGDYKIETDSYNFIVKRIDTVEVKNEDGEVTGTKLVEKVVGYTANLDQALNLIKDNILYVNDDLKDICEKLQVLSIKIGGIKEALERVVKSE